MHVTDAHVHLWRLADRPQPWIDPVAMAVIHRDFTEQDLTAAAAGAGVDEVVLVQVLNREDETEDLLRRAAGCPLVSGVVGWVDLAAVDVEDRLDRLRGLAGGELLRGVRHQAQAEPDPGAWIGRPEVHRGMARLGAQGLVCDLMMRPAQLEPTTAAVRALPQTTFVLDHAGKPPVAAGWHAEESRSWHAGIRRLARAPNACCKLSGLTTTADLERWTVEDLRPFAEAVLEAFGSGRVLFGSDWPVSLRAGDHARTVTGVRELLAPFGAEEAAAVLSRTARRVYRLGDASAA
ncbi:amidohydrolase [Geodermatophilus sp. TF02-6]|uniref:amidohydrolase family protein n=1 Tax=Geodermatophilus sp. TF02-6 TaxID=2250575 RepID=UPI000DE9F0EF|nr:amidohydrolase family protein [Geodermatophilus sp. TF02-6]RBY83686.1 amidohydrolase [Geodermatophilus sp. TF02-6]